MDTLTIGELSKVVGLNTPTIRYYEEIGLIPPAQRSASGYRVYSEEDAQRLRFIQRAKMLSLSLDEIKQMVSTAVDGHCTTLQHELLVLLRTKLEQTRQRTRELEEFEQELERFCDDLSAKMSPGRDVAQSTPEFCDCLGEE